MSGEKSKGGAEMPGGFQKMIKDLWGMISPAMDTLTGQMEELLLTGGVGAHIPMIARAQEAQRTAISQGMQGTEEQYAQQGLAGTPFATSNLAEMAMGGRQSLANIGPQMAMNMMAGIPGFLGGQASSVMGATAGTRTAQDKSKGWGSQLPIGVGLNIAPGGGGGGGGGGN